MAKYLTKERGIGKATQNALHRQIPPKKGGFASRSIKNGPSLVSLAWFWPTRIPIAMGAMLVNGGGGAVYRGDQKSDPTRVPGVVFWSSCISYPNEYPPLVVVRGKPGVFRLFWNCLHREVTRSPPRPSGVNPSERAQRQPASPIEVPKSSRVLYRPRPVLYGPGWRRTRKSVLPFGGRLPMLAWGSTLPRGGVGNAARNTPQLLRF